MKPLPLRLLFWKKRRQISSGNENGGIPVRRECLRSLVNDENGEEVRRWEAAEDEERRDAE